MNGYLTAISVETRKASASHVTVSVTIFLLVGLAALVVGLELGVRAGNEQIASQLGPLAEADGWDRMCGTAAQVTSAGALLAVGVVLSWLVGREFSDGTITSLFGLVVSLPVIVLAKLTVYVAWVIAVGAATLVVLAGIGLALGFGAPDAAVAFALARQFALVVLMGLVAVPAAWIATLLRGVLPGIAATVGLLVCGQVLAIAGVGAWVPVAVPALWALSPETVSAAQLALVVTLPLLFGALTLRSWARLQLDR